MATGAAGPTGAAPTGAASTGAVPTGATSTGATGATGPEDPRLRKLQIPEKYGTEPWAKEVKSVEDLWDKMAGANKLIGKDKIALPGDNATAEELTAFYTRMGRPENAEGYEFKSIEALKEVDRNVEMDHKMKTLLFNRGVSKTVAEGIVADYETMMYDIQKPFITESVKRDQDFQTLATEVLGADKDGAMDAFKAVMRESLGDKGHLMSKIEQMSNEELLPLIVLSKNIHDKYTGENRVSNGPGGGQQLSGDLKTDFQTLSTQKLNIKMDMKMPPHIKKQKLENLNAQMTKIGAKAHEQGIDVFK